MKPVLIRPISHTDFEELADFFQHNNVPAVTEHFHPFELSRTVAYNIATLPRADHYYGAFVLNRVVGMVMLRGWDAGYAVPSLGIIINRDNYRQKLGGLLMRHAIDAARQMSVVSIRLTVSTSNTSAVQLYSGLGFRVVRSATVGDDSLLSDTQTMLLELSSLHCGGVVMNRHDDSPE